MWIRRKVKPGNQLGRHLGHPTLNFSVGAFGLKYKPGVYACEVRIHGKIYKGALYFGPKLNHRGQTLEIYVLDYSGNIYGQYVHVKPGKKLREPKKFSSSELLKKQIQKDVARIV
ncbi:MAG: riboflavin kinase [Patescibacteria group bacterium]